MRARRITAAAGAAATATSVVVAGAAPKPVPPAGAGPAARSTASTASAPAQANCWDDAFVVDQDPIINTGVGTTMGQIQLVYSRACRSVKAKAFFDICSSPYVGKATVRHNGQVTGTSPICDGSGDTDKTMTGWVNDAGIQQYAKGEMSYFGDVYGVGVTIAY